MSTLAYFFSSPNTIMSAEPARSSFVFLLFTAIIVSFSFSPNSWDGVVPTRWCIYFVHLTRGQSNSIKRFSNKSISLLVNVTSIFNTCPNFSVVHFPVPCTPSYHLFPLHHTPLPSIHASWVPPPHAAVVLTAWNGKFWLSQKQPSKWIFLPCILECFDQVTPEAVNTNAIHFTVFYNCSPIYLSLQILGLNVCRVWKAEQSIWGPTKWQSVWWKAV